MGSNTYRFNGKTFMQSEGGPIGLELSEAVARVFMLVWDRRLLAALEKAGRGLAWDLYMMLRYIDDSNCVAEEMPMGTRLVRGKLVVQKDKVAQDMLVPGDQRTATLVQNIANKVCKFIQMEVDYPSKYEDNLVPILDLKVAVQNQKVLQLPDHCRQVCHEERLAV